MLEGVRADIGSRIELTLRKLNESQRGRDVGGGGGEMTTAGCLGWTELELRGSHEESEQ